MFNRQKKIMIGARESGAANQGRETIVLKAAQLAPDLMMKRYWMSSNYPYNHLAEKLPLHHRTRSQRHLYQSNTLSSEHSSPEPLSVDEDARYPQHTCRNPSFSPKTSNLQKNYPTFSSGDRVLPMENPISPGVPVLYRTAEEKSINPDRLNLDRRRFTVCPVLEGEEPLRLLNYQHNLIKKIEHVNYLNKLIFLDFYDNQIEEIDGLSHLKSLRVLMLGKNRFIGLKLSKVLFFLYFLILFFLLSLQLSEITNLNHLSELRVLNLAGNLLKHVENLNGMDSLMELNLRRNRIQSVSDIDCLPSLQRLYLSFNEICSFSAVSCLSDSSSLSEVSLDGNPIAIEHSYRQNVLYNMQQLRLLDMRRVSEDERRMALVAARKEEERKREMRKIATLKEKRRVAINNAKKQWDVIQGSLMSHVGKTGKIPELYTSHVGSYPNTRRPNDTGIPQNKDVTTIFDDVFHISGKLEKLLKYPAGSHSAQSDVPSTATDVPSTATDVTSTSIDVPSASTDVPSTPNLSDEQQESEIQKNSGSKTHNEQLKSTKQTFIFRSPSNIENDECDLNNLAELDDNSLAMYGIGSLEALDRTYGIPTAGSVTTILFNFIDFDEIVKHLPKLKSRFPGLVCLVLNACNIHSLTQLNALATVRRLDHIVIDEVNPVTKFSLWRYYLLFRLAHFSLKTINNKEVTATDIVHAEHLFGTFSHLMTTYLTSAQLITLVSETKKKQILATLEERNKKATDTKFFDKSQEELAGRSILVYPGSSRQQKSKICKKLAKEYVSEIVRNVLHAEKKRSEVSRIWPELFEDFLLNILSDMDDTNTYIKNWFDKLEKS
eukprot:XP_014783100.1 PREDICTED: leucine-rich repeat-containing protein 49-like [Octopus bimaculoides]